MGIEKAEPVVVITGASTGIGRAGAIALARAGFVTYAGVRKEADVAGILAEDRKLVLGGRLRPIILDVQVPATLAAAVETIKTAHGGRLAGLINNAGVVLSGPVEVLSMAEWRQQFEVNVFGLVAVTQAFLPMIRASKGRIINVSSIGGKIAFPFIGAYNASKYAVEALTDSLRMELIPHGVKVIDILPGAVRTAIFGKGFGQLDRLIAGLTQEQEGAYGVDVRKGAAMWKKMETQGCDPMVLGKVMVKCMTNSQVKARYVVGMDAWMQAAMKFWLPDRWLDGVTRRFMGL